MQKVKIEVVVENQLEPIPTPAVENAQPVEEVVSETPPVLVIPRVVFNYIVIAIVFFVLGAGVSFAVFTVNNNENRQLIDDAVNAAVAKLPKSADTVSGEPNANEQYEVSVGNDPVRGNAEAQVVMIEFSDFNCSFCGRFAQQTLNPLMEAYGDRVKFVYRDYPILAQSSLDAALAAQCAFEQDQFWEYHNILFTTGKGQFARDFYLQTAKDLELDADKFTACLDNQTYRDEVLKDFNEAQQLGLRGTPSFFINGRYISGAQPYEVFAKALDEELAKAANPQAPSGS